MTALVDEMNDFIQRKFLYQQFVPNHQIHFFNQIFPGTGKPFRTEQIDQPSHPTIDVHPSSKERVSIAPRRDTKLPRVEPESVRVQPDLTGMMKMFDSKKTRYHQKFVYNNCRYTGHSARDCRHRKNAASAYRNIPCDKQNPEEKRGFCKDLKRRQQRQYPANALHEVQETDISCANESDKADSLN